MCVRTVKPRCAGDGLGLFTFSLITAKGPLPFLSGSRIAYCDTRTSPLRIELQLDDSKWFVGCLSDGQSTSGAGQRSRYSAYQLD